MDVVTYALAKKMASSVASGITEIETNGTTIRFKTTSGDWFTVTLNSINEVSVSANGHLIVKLSDGTQIDCGALPVGTMDSSLSTTSENGVQNKVITNALNGKQNTLVQGSGITIDTTDPSHPQISANIDYTNLINKPTKLSDFTNDENFITNTANNLSNYYLKTETYTQSEVNDLISQLASLSVEIVETLPTSDISTTTIYLINVPDTTNYVQWMYINNAWANIGSTSVDLTNYYTKTQVNTLLNDKVDKVSGKGLSTNDFTNAYKSILDNYTVDSTLDSTSTNPVQNAVVTQALDTKQPKTLSSPITIGGTSQTTVESALGGINSLCGTKLTMVTSLPLSPSNQETVLYIGNSSGSLLCGGIYQYQVSEWVMISNVSSFTFNSDEFAVDSTTNEVSLKPSYADIPSFLPNNVSSSNKLATNSSITAITDLIPSNATSSNKLVAKSDTAKRKDVAITATASIENDIKTLLDTLITETSGSYIGSFTRTGNTSGYYSVSVSSTWNITGIVSICGAVSNAYRVAKFKNSEQGAYTYEIEKLVTENEATLRHAISIPVESGTTFYDVWDALQYQLIHTDWTFLTSSDWNSASGGYELQGYYWGEYCATHTTNNNVVITGTITWGAKPHTFSAYHDPTVPAWKININGEELMYNADNITVTKDVSTGRRIFVRNTGNTNIGALYNALQSCDLLNRPSTGIFNWTIQQSRTCNLGTPYDGNHWTNPVTVGELAYFQNPRVSAINSATSEWWLFWSDGNVYGSCNMWGETNPLCTYIALEYII